MRDLNISILGADALSRFPADCRDLVLRISPAGCETAITCDLYPGEVLGFTYNYSIIEEQEAWGLEEFFFFKKEVLQPMRNVYLLIDSTFESLFPSGISMYRSSSLLRQMWSSNDTSYNKDEIWTEINVDGFPRAGVLISSSLLKYLNRTFQTFNLEWAPARLVKEWHQKLTSNLNRSAVNVFVSTNDITTDVGYFDGDCNLITAVTYSFDNTLENIAFYIISSIRLLTGDNIGNSIIHLDGKPERIKELNNLLLTENPVIAGSEVDSLHLESDIVLSDATISFVKSLRQD